MSVEQILDRTPYGLSRGIIFPVILRVQGLLLASLSGDEKAMELVKEHDSYPRNGFEGTEGHAIEVAELQPTDVIDEEGKQAPRRFRRRWLLGKDAPPQICVDEHMIQGLLRETIARGEFSFPRGFVRGCYCWPRVIPLEMSEGGYLTEADLKMEVRCFTGMTMQGPRNLLIEHEALLDPMIRFSLELLPGAGETKKKAEDKKGLEKLAERTREVLRFASVYGGLGAGRRKSGLDYDYGIFEVEFPESPK